MNSMKKIITLFIITGLFCSVSLATLTPVTPATTWLAGVDGLDEFFAADYSTANGYAELTVSNTNYANGRRALFTAFEIPAVGTYTYRIDSKFSDYNSQYNYFHVYLFNDGAIFPLTPEAGMGMLPVGAALVSNTSAPAGKDDESWYSYEIDYEITQAQADSKRYIGFYFVGSKVNDSQTLAYDNFSINVPEPTTIAILGLGSLLILKPKKKSVL